MAQNVLVDLDLNTNLIHNLSDAVDPLDAVNKQQLDAVVTGGHVPAVGADAIAVDATLQTVTLVLDPASGELTQGPTGLAIDLSGYALTSDNDLKADKTVTVTAGDGLTGGGTLAGPDVPLAVLADPAADNALIVGPTGLYVPPAAAATVVSVTGTAPVVVTDVAGDITVGIDQAAIDGAIAYVDAADATLQAAIDTEITARTDADLLKADKVVTVTPGLGLQGGGTLAGPDVPLSVLLDPAVDNTLIVGPTGLYVPPAAAATVTSVTGVAGEIVVTNTAGSHVVGIDPAYTTGAQAYVDAGDLVLSDRIDGLSLTGTGAAVVTGDSTAGWVVTVDSLQLANTYVGPGTDSASINTDIAPAVGEPGDLYINDTTGSAFVCSDGTTWVELAQAPAGIVSITSPDASINVIAGTPPTASLQVSDALQAEIAASTATNLVQDADILALEAQTHVAAASGNGTSVDPVSQVVAVVADPASPEVTVSAAGVKVDLTAYAKAADANADLALKADKGTMINAGIGLQGGGNLGADLTIDVGVAAAGGLQADASGLWVDTGKALGVDADGLSVKVGTGLTYNTTTDAIDLDPTAIHVPAVGANAITVDPTTQLVGLVIDPAGPELTQGPTGLLITLPPAANVVAGDVTCDGITAATFAHGLNTSDVTVAVKSGLCYVTAGVCEVDANTVSIEAAAGTYRVIVAGVVL